MPTSTSQRHEAAGRRGSGSSRPTVNSSTSSASGLLKRKINAAAGVHARAAPANSPAAAPCSGYANALRTAKYSTATDATPISAWGASTDQLFMPNNRTDNPVTHSDAGGLSTVMKLFASSEPKNHAAQLCDPA